MPLTPAGNKDKRLAALDIVNVSIKIYFRLNTLRLCKNLIRTVASRQFAPFDAFPASQRVTYRFYVGRLAVFDEDYVRLGGGRRAVSLGCLPTLRLCRDGRRRRLALVLSTLRCPLPLLFTHCSKRRRRASSTRCSTATGARPATRRWS